MFTKITAVLIVFLLSATAYATDYVIHVHGIVCSFCAHGVTKNISKLSFIDQSKYTKGVKIEIEDQKVTIAVQPDHDIDVPALYEAIRSGGYDPVNIWTTTPSGELDQKLDYEQ